jgi:hypothetical protein
LYYRSGFSANTTGRRFSLAGRHALELAGCNSGMTPAAARLLSMVIVRYSAPDMLIAAPATEGEFERATCNLRAYLGCGMQVVDPFDDLWASALSPFWARRVDANVKLTPGQIFVRADTPRRKCDGWQFLRFGQNSKLSDKSQ